MKKTVFSIVLIVFSILQLSAQESVKILLNDNERFRFVNDRLEFLNPNNNILIGDSAGVNLGGDPNAINNVMIGYRAGFSSESGIRNVYIGDSAGYVSTGSYNTYVGTRAGRHSTGSIGNSFFGGSSGRYNTTGFRNTYIGGITGAFNEEGHYNTYVGHSTGLDSRGSYNTALGRQAGYYNKGDSCVFIGNMAGFNDTTSQKLYISNSDTDNPLIYGDFQFRIMRLNINRLELRSEQHNVIIGDSAGIGNTTGRGNIFLGYKAGHDNMEGNDNVFIGDSAGYFNTSGNYNTSVGAWAGYASTESTRNSFFGVLSGCYNTTGHRNTYLGSFAGSYNDTGSYNVYVGHASGYASSGTANVAVGRYAGLNNKGDSCVFLGYMAGRNDTTSNKLYIANSDNPKPLIYGEFDNEILRIHGTLDIKGEYQFPLSDGTGGEVLKTDGSGNLGWSADSGANEINDLSDGKTGGYSVFLGPGAGSHDDGSDNWNVAMGLAALQYTETGEHNTAIGSLSLYTNVAGNGNTAIGDQALYYNTTSYNTATGFKALYENTIGQGNTAIGYVSLSNNENGANNTSVGANSMYFNVDGGNNTACGVSSLYKNTGGDENAAFGAGALLNNTTGFYNTAIGNGSMTANLTGNGNIAVGYKANYYNQNGSYNTVIGYEAGHGNSQQDITGNVFIGYQAGYNETGSNKLYIENTSSDKPLIYGDFDSDTLRINGTFDINGEYRFPDTAGYDGNVLISDAGGNLEWGTVQGDFSDGGDAVGDSRTLGNTDNYALDFITNNASRLTINDDGGIRLDGNLGIFTDPSDAGSVNKSIKLYSSGTFSNPYMYVSGDNSATIQLESRRVGQTTGQLWNITSGSGSTGDLDRFAIYNQADGVCLSIRSGAKTGIATNTPSATLHVDGSTGYDQLRLETSYTPIGTSDANGNTGDIAWDDDYVYVKTSTGWKRAALSTW